VAPRTLTSAAMSCCFFSPVRHDQTMPDPEWGAWMRALGAAIRSARELAGLTQHDVARLSGVSQGAVSRLECTRFRGPPLLLEAEEFTMHIPSAVSERFPATACWLVRAAARANISRRSSIPRPRRFELGAVDLRLTANRQHSDPFRTPRSRVPLRADFFSWTDPIRSVR
jgi:transcriptional regulator with XRE-family HTH domain